MRCFFATDISERLSGPLEDYTHDNLSSNCDNLRVETDTYSVGLDDIVTDLDDLDSLEMGNTHGRHSGRLFVKSKKRNRRKSEVAAERQDESVERKVEEDGENTRFVFYKFYNCYKYFLCLIQDYEIRMHVLYKI